MATLHLPAAVRHRPHLPTGWVRFAPAVSLFVFLVWFAQVPGAQRSWLDIGVEATYLAAIALGVNLLTGYTGLLSLGHAGFFVAGGYAGAVWAPAWGLSPWAGLPVAFVFGAAMGALLALLCCHLRGFYLTVVTLAFGSLLPALVVVLKAALGGPTGRSVVSPIDTGALPFANGDPYRGLFILSSLWLFVTLGLCWNLVRSKWGRASMAIRESQLAAEASGVGTYLHKVSAFAVSAGIVAVAGVIGAERFLLVSPGAGGQEQSFRYVVVLALGGLGTLAGPIIGAMSITFGFGISWVQEHLVNQQGLVFGMLGLVGVGLAPEGTMGNLRKLAWFNRLSSRTGAASFPHRESAGPSSVEALRVRAASETPALELHGLTKRFGGLVALDGIDLVVASGTVHGLIGPNGSGKTTLLNLVSGVTPASGGRVLIGGRDGGQASAHRRAASGVARTFQNLHLWRRMTVRDNVLVGCHRSLHSNMLQSALHTPAARRAETAARAQADALLDLVGLGGQGDQLAGSLPFAEQRRLEIARALALDPDLLLLDEPAAGLHPADLKELLTLINRLKATGITILIVEHHMELLMKVCDQVTVLDFGEKIAEGTPRAIQRNKAVIAAYLGTDAA
jgi:ABC-type branched-subunit amino acid transport system ATPase component/ABC-type branched-subunit amino acid transport system permease subunit